MSTTYTPIASRTAAHEAMRENVCLLCRQTKEVGRTNRWYCRACGIVARKARQAAQRAEHLKDAAIPRNHDGQRPCKGWCGGKLFYSEDVRRITRCPQCRQKLFYLEETLSCDAARYDTEGRTDGDAYKLLHRKFGKAHQITSQDHKTLQAAEMRDGYKGIPFRRLSQREIAEIYTPERVDGILEQARENSNAAWAPDMRSL